MIPLIFDTNLPSIPSPFSPYFPLVPRCSVPSFSGCPSSCRECQGWAEASDGPVLWIWVTALSVIGPLLLLLLRSTAFEAGIF